MDVIRGALIVLMMYMISVAISCFINSNNSTRIPRGVGDLVKLTFLPYVVYCMTYDRDKLN